MEQSFNVIALEYEKAKAGERLELADQKMDRNVSEEYGVMSWIYNLEKLEKCDVVESRSRSAMLE